MAVLDFDISVGLFQNHLLCLQIGCWYH